MTGRRVLLLSGTLTGIACGERAPMAPAPVPPTPPVVYVPGQSYFGPSASIEYIAGNAPVIITAPHGGSERPTQIPVRTCGTNVRDTNTLELARAVSAAYRARYGRYPHVVINLLHRDRLDANRDSLEASCGAPAAGAAWKEFHGFVETAKAAIAASNGRGFLVDLHGHGHAIQRLELGYLLSGATLDRPNASLDADASVLDGSSIRTIARAAGAAPPSTLLRGPTSLGSLMAAEGFPSIPSASDPGPAGAEYFTGGYITERHGCRDGGPSCAIQLEANFVGVRDTEEHRSRFAVALIGAVGAFLRQHWGLDLGA